MSVLPIPVGLYAGYILNICRMSSILMHEGAIHIQRELNRVYIIFISVINFNPPAQLLVVQNILMYLFNDVGCIILHVSTQVDINAYSVIIEKSYE